MQGGLGLPKSMIAKMYGISVKTLDECYGEDWELGKAYRVQRLAKSALSHADFDGALALKILERTPELTEWKPPVQQKQEVAPEEKAPVIDSSKLSQDERDQLERLCLIALGQRPAEIDEVTPDPES